MVSQELHFGNAKVLYSILSCEPLDISTKMLIRKSEIAPVGSKATEGLFIQRIYALVCRASQYHKSIIAGGITSGSPMVKVHHFHLVPVQEGLPKSIA